MLFNVINNKLVIIIIFVESKDFNFFFSRKDFLYIFLIFNPNNILLKSNFIIFNIFFYL